MSRMFANGPGDLGSIPDRGISKTQKIVLDVDRTFRFILDEINKGYLLLEYIETEKCSRRVS